MTVHTGRHFLQIPGPTNVPDRVLRAMDMPTMDHRGAGIRRDRLCRDGGDAACVPHQAARDHLPSSGTGAWEAAIVNTLAARRQGADGRDRPVRGAVARHRRQVQARRRFHSGRLAPWRRPRADRGAQLAADKAHKIKAVCVVHNETSTACVTYPLDVRKILDTHQASGAPDGRHHLRPRLAGI